MIDFTELSQGEQLQVMGAMDPLIWVVSNKIKLGGHTYQIKDHEYQADIISCNDRVQVCIKGAQMGITEVWVLKTLWGMIHGRYPQGALYLFPTQNDVGDFSKARFDPLIEGNQSIGQYVNSTDSQFIKRIHEGFLYLRGARATKAIGGEKKSSAQLKSIPVDRIVLMRETR
jgi:phage terminase large subunit GpA-like protein